MYSIDTAFLVRIMIGLYALAAVSAILTAKNKKTANILPNIICILASAAGIAASIIHILGGTGRFAIFDLKLPVQLLSIYVQFDSLSAFFVLGLSVLVLCVSIYSIGYLSHYYEKRSVGLFNFLYSSFILSMLFVLMAGNTVFFFISWEVMSLVSYFLVVFEAEHKENQKAGTIYIVMTHVGTAFLFIAFMIIYSYSGSFDMFSGTGTMPDTIKNIIFVLFLIGFGTKAGILPLHIWLPYAHPAASSNISALMSGIMIKTAVYGLVRFLFGCLGVSNLWWGTVVLILGMLSAVLGVAYALMEHNIKRLLAYCSIENIGIILMGLGISMIAYSQGNMILCSLAMTASLFHTFNHAVFKGGLFLGAGSIQYSTHTKDIEKLGGLIKSMPYTSVFMLCFSLAICAVVPFNGFVSEWLTYQSLFLNISSGYPALNIISIFGAAALAMAGAMGLASFVKLFGVSFLGLPRSDSSIHAKEVPVSMRIGMGMLAGICVFLGLFPLEFLRIIDKVSYGINGISILNSFQGRFMYVYYPINISSGSITPVYAFIMIVALTLLVLGVIRLIGGKMNAKKYGTWDCGFEALNSKMQYSATGFSKPLRIVFRILYRPGRELQVEDGVSPYYPKSMKYVVSTEKIFEKYLYYPLLGFIKKLSRKLKFTIQTGSVHMYLIYIFAAVLALMLYNSLSQ